MTLQGHEVAASSNSVPVVSTFNGHIKVLGGETVPGSFSDVYP